MQYIQTKTVYIDRDELIEIKAIEHDVKTRFIDFKFIAANKILDISHCIVRVYALNSKGNEIFNNLTVIDGAKGIARLELTDALLVPGTTEYMLKITTDNGGILSSNRFNLIVDKDLMTGNAIEGTNEYKALDEALKLVGNIHAIDVKTEENANSINQNKKLFDQHVNKSTEFFKHIDDYLKTQETVLVMLNQYGHIAKVGTDEEDWSLAFNHVFKNVVKNTCAKITWNGQLKVKSTINVPYGVSLEGIGLPYSGLVPTADFNGEWIIEDKNIKSHNSYKNIYLSFQNNDSVKGLNFLNPYDYCQVDKIIGDGNNNTFISIGGSAISQTLHLSDCICYAKSTCTGALYVIKNLQEPHIVNNKALFAGTGSTHPMYCDGVTNAKIENNSFGFSTATGLKMVCIDYPKRMVGNLIEGNLFENCKGEYAIEIIGNSNSEYEGNNNTIRDNTYFGGSEKIYVDAISDIFIVDKAMLQRGSSARRVTFIQKYDSNSNDPYENLTIGFDGKKVNITGDVYANSFTGTMYFPWNGKLASIRYDADELIFNVNGVDKMKLKNNHIYNWCNGGGVVLWSPNGTGYLTTVTDEGTLKTTQL
ncbi:MAG: BppU family phage baseplate upper protein [Clostridium perfringens]|nr:BppU family phage baseplate upper protein [Clostridium perfringens]